MEVEVVKPGSNSVDSRLNEVVYDVLYQEDISELLNLLDTCRIGNDVDPMTLGGIWIVAKHEGKIIGSIWAMVEAHVQKFAYISYFCVHPDYRIKRIHHSSVPFTLSTLMETALIKTGITHYTAIVPPYMKRLIRFHNRFGGKSIGKHFVIIGKANGR